MSSYAAHLGAQKSVRESSTIAGQILMRWSVYYLFCRYPTGRKPYCEVTTPRPKPGCGIAVYLLTFRWPRNFATYWPEIRGGLIADLNTRYPFFEGAVFKKRLLEQWVIDNDVRYWPRTPTGQLCTDAETLRAIAQRCPQAAEFCHGKIALDQLKTFNWRSATMGAIAVC